jgi:hypothetical protein
MTLLLLPRLRRLSNVDHDHEVIKMLVLFCAVGLLLSIILILSGADLRADVF